MTFGDWKGRTKTKKIISFCENIFLWTVNVCFVHKKSLDEIKTNKKYMYAFLYFRVGLAQKRFEILNYWLFFKKLSTDFRLPYSGISDVMASAVNSRKNSGSRLIFES